MNDKEINCGIHSLFNADGSIILNSETTFAPNGYAVLAILDSNGDSIIDANDPASAQLKLWRDMN